MTIAFSSPLAAHPSRPLFLRALTLLVATCLLPAAVRAQAVAFDAAHPAKDWRVTSGAIAPVAPGAAGQEQGVAPVDQRLLKLASPALALPAELEVRLALAPKATISVTVDQAGQTEPALFLRLIASEGNNLGINAKAHGQPLHMLTISSILYSKRHEPSGSASYGWRFPLVGNIWDDNDRAEIGSDYQSLTPFAQKWFVLRLRVSDQGKQIWLDDRLIAEDRQAAPGAATPAATQAADASLGLHISAGAKVLSVKVLPLQAEGAFQTLRLDDYQSDGRPRPAGELLQGQVAGGVVPLRPMGPKSAAIDLGPTLDRYRMTHGSGPNAGYVNGQVVWPNPLEIDPALPSFRVPYRAYQNAYLLVYLDDERPSVPAGTFRFYRDAAGYCATTHFRVDEQAIAAGLVTVLPQKGPQGQKLYLVRVPVDSAGLAGFADMAQQFLDFQITKPVTLTRSYPDPISYGEYPAGLPSSVHVLGITLEEAAFELQSVPAQFGHVFEQPEVPSYRIALTSHSGREQQVKITLSTRSYDGQESHEFTANSALAAGQKAEVNVPLPGLGQRGWHELIVRAQAGSVVREERLSLVLLPKNTRSYGNSAEETRFGVWTLWGHYTPFQTNPPANEPVLAMLRKLGVRMIGFHGAFIDGAMARKYDFLPNGPHTLISLIYTLKQDDPADIKKMNDGEVKAMRELHKYWDKPTYFYGGEWNYDHRFSHAANTRYTGKGPWVFDETAQKNLKRQVFIFEQIGRALRQELPTTRLILQWGNPQNSPPLLEAGFPRDLVDGLGMDAPMFEILPETPVAVGGINCLWTVRQELARIGVEQLPITWCEGPFFPTNPGALTLREQEENHIRYFLLGMAYGIESFQAGIVPFDAGNYYGAEHYGAGVFNRVPLVTPKPAVAAIATATRVLCGAKVAGPIDTGVPTTYCLSFRQPSGAMLYALWRVRGQVQAQLQVSGGGSAVVTNAMGNEQTIAAKDGKLALTISTSPVWLSGVEAISGFTFAAPTYEAAPAAHSAVLADFTAENWQYDGSAIPDYENNHFAEARTPDSGLSVPWADQAGPHGPSAKVTLAAQPAGDRPLAARYGALVAKKAIPIPGKAAALGMWVDGNSSWGRIIFRLRDAKGEIWTSVGTPNDWNCSDTHGWSYVCFEGWRYLSFPLPSNAPYDASRELESTWWKHHEGDGIVDLPLSVDRLIVEARNEVHVVGQMTLVPRRDYQLAGLRAEYLRPKDAGQETLALYRQRKTAPVWPGPADNPIARFEQEGTAPAPKIDGFEEPPQFNDGRRMFIRFQEQEGATYQLYLARYPDGRGAQKLGTTVHDKGRVIGLRPGIPMYLFLVSSQGKPLVMSKPSPAFKLITEDKFAEK